MNTKSEKKPLSSHSISVMKPSDGVMADIGENVGLRVRSGKTGVKTFFYRYRSPVTDKLIQMTIGHFRKPHWLKLV